MKLSEQAMEDIDKLIDDIDKLNKEQIVAELLTLHGYMAIIDAEGDREME